MIKNIVKILNCVIIIPYFLIYPMKSRYIIIILISFLVGIVGAMHYQNKVEAKRKAATELTENLSPVPPQEQVVDPNMDVQIPSPIGRTTK